ncbi:hypothetical protein [Streptomyces virginiae]|uniref:hypothetical protein n=1 Tax=Streptomyces virginiae TaxID=1961 RepID=UPI0036581EA9
MSAYLNEIIKGLRPKGRAALLATAAAADGRVPYDVHDNTLESLYRKRLVREVRNRKGGFNWSVLTTLGKRVAAALAERPVRPARPVKAAAPAPAEPTRPPVALVKQPASWQVLWYAESPLTGEQWADLPVHSVVRTEQLLAGQDWDVVDARLTEQGLKRYGFPVREDYPVAVSASHALSLARELWETEGPHAQWFRFLDDEAPYIEEMRAAYDPTPEQERAAYEYAVAAVANPLPALTFADLRAIAAGQQLLA